MAKAFINDTHLTDIADAIRATLDESRQYLPSEMAAAIQSIPVMAQLNRKKYFQSVPTGAASGYATIEQIEGNTVAWNQLVDTGDTSCTVPNGHVYYANISGTSSIATSDGNAFAVTGGTDIIHDLTQMFGAGNEPTTVADFEAWLAQNGLPSVADYNAGELLSVKMNGVKSVGFNQWDEEWINADIDNAGDVTTGNRLISKNYIPILPSTNYYFYGTAAGEIEGNLYIQGYWYDINHEFISRTNFMVNGVKTSPSNARFLMFKMATVVTSYNNDICINLSDPSKNGTYQPYMTDSADIDVTTITGINTATNVRETIFPQGMKQVDRAGTVKDTLDILSGTATVNVGSRAYQSGDESDPDVLTDGTTTYYALTTPIEYTDLQDGNGNPLNPRYKVEQGGTEQVLPVNTSTPITVAPTLSTIYKKNI